MDKCSATQRRAYSLLELVAVLAIIGLLAGAAALRWGDDALSNVSAEGFARRVGVALQLARRQAIAEGVSAAVILQRDSGVVISADVVRADGSDAPTEEPIDVPPGVTVTPAADRWEFAYTGELNSPAAGGQIVISTSNWTWTLTVNAATGHVSYVRSL